MNRRVLSLAILTFLGATGTLTGSARANGDRVYWQSAWTHFENTGGNVWVETTPDATFRFLEQTRNPQFVVLYDPSRACTVLLFADHALVKFGNGPFAPYAWGPGGWR